MIRAAIHCLICRFFYIPLADVFGPRAVLLSCSKCLIPVEGEQR